MARIEQVLAGEATWGEYGLDILGHAGLGAAYTWAISTAATVALGWGGGPAVVAGSVAAPFGGLVREVVQGIKSGKLHPLDRALDVAHHLLGIPIGLGLWLVTTWAISALGWR